MWKIISSLDAQSLVVKLLIVAGDPVIPQTCSSPSPEPRVEEQRHGAAYGEQMVLCDCKFCARNNWIPRWRLIEHKRKWDVAPLPKVG